MDGKNLSYLHDPTPLRNVPLNSFSTVFTPNLAISYGIFDSKKKKGRAQTKKIHSAYILNIGLSLNNK